jgi:ABC-type nickel/cobalt efflux system permease component RcnA
VTVRGLLALGISGGLIPCPSALVVLLAAVALHRVAFGMLLITAFSLGLAGVLMALGLLVVYARQWLERVPVSAALLRRVPIASAGVITLIGVGLLVRTLGGGGP